MTPTLREVCPIKSTARQALINDLTERRTVRRSNDGSHIILETHLNVDATKKMAAQMRELKERNDTGLNRKHIAKVPIALIEKVRDEAGIKDPDCPWLPASITDDRVTEAVFKKLRDPDFRALSQCNKALLEEAIRKQSYKV